MITHAPLDDLGNVLQGLPQLLCLVEAQRYVVLQLRLQAGVQGAAPYSHARLIRADRSKAGGQPRGDFELQVQGVWRSDIYHPAFACLESRAIKWGHGHNGILARRRAPTNGCKQGR